MMRNNQQTDQQEWKTDSGTNEFQRASSDTFAPQQQQQQQQQQSAHPDEPTLFDYDAVRQQQSILEYMPTPFNPPRIDRCRFDNFLMLGIMVLMFIFGVAALATPIVQYTSSSISITVDCVYVRGVRANGVHQRNSNNEVFCSDFTTKSDGFAALFIICVLFSVLGFVLALVPIVCGRVICCRYFVHVLIALCWFFIMVGMILGAQMRNEELCHSTSLKSIGFKYGPAFGLAVTLFVLFTLVLILLVVWTICRPATLRY